MKKIDILNQRFGKLLVVGKNGNYSTGEIKWKCLCDCGNTINSKSGPLRKNIKKSCPNCLHEDFTNQTIGKLTVVKKLPDKIDKNGSKVILWECVCECGEIVARVSAHLKRGNCSCHKCKAEYDKILHYKGFEEISGIHWTNVKRQANLRGFEFNLDIKEMWELFLKQNRKCAISGVDICFAKTKKEYLKNFTTASIDRIDSNLGYTRNNVQWVHKKINLMKSDMTQNEFIDICKSVVKYNEGKYEEITLSVQNSRR